MMDNNFIDGFLKVAEEAEPMKPAGAVERVSSFFLPGTTRAFNAPWGHKFREFTKGSIRGIPGFGDFIARWDNPAAMRRSVSARISSRKATAAKKAAKSVAAK